MAPGQHNRSGQHNDLYARIKWILEHEAADPRGSATKVEAISRQITGAQPLAYAAFLLAKGAGTRGPLGDLAQRLGQQAMERFNTADSVMVMPEGFYGPRPEGVSTYGHYALHWLLKTFGPDFLTGCPAYVQENQAIRVSYYELIGRMAGQAAVPRMIDGLFDPFDHTRIYGGVKWPIYVGRFVDALAPLDVSEHLDRLWALAEDKSKHVRRHLTRLLGGQPSAEGGAIQRLTARKSAVREVAIQTLCTLDTHRARAALTARIETERAKALQALIEAHLAGATEPPEWKGPTYSFDAYAQALWPIAGRAILSAHRPGWGEFSRIKLVHHDLTYEIIGAIVESASGLHAVEFEGPDHNLPTHIDEISSGERGPRGAGPLNDLLRHHGEDTEDEDMPRWGDAYELPECVYRWAIIEAAQALKQALLDARLPVGPARAVMGGHDDDWGPEDGFDRMALKQLATLPAGLRRDLLRLCLDEPSALTDRDLHSGA